MYTHDPLLKVWNPEQLEHVVDEPDKHFAHPDTSHLVREQNDPLLIKPAIHVAHELGFPLAHVTQFAT